MVCYNYEKPSYFTSECRHKKVEQKPTVKDEGYYKAKYMKLKAKREKSLVVDEADWAETSSDEEDDI